MIVPFWRGAGARLRFVEADTGPLIRETYALRYRIYCEECGFLPQDEYPSKFETDDFDAHALHFAAVDGEYGVVGTVRLVTSSQRGFPLQRFCPIPDDVRALADSGTLGEISRLAVSATARRGLVPAESVKSTSDRPAALYARAGVAMGLYREIYRASKREGLSHLLAAMEAPLARLMSRFAFPFRPVGPTIDYYGPVRPYLGEIAEWESVMFERCPDTFDWFTEGLPAELRPFFARRSARNSRRVANAL